jgi:hypothetical protein
MGSHDPICPAPASQAWLLRRHAVEICGPRLIYIKVRSTRFAESAADKNGEHNMWNSLAGTIFSHPLVIGLGVVIVGALFVLEGQHGTRN